jgi:protein O-GlcNAc transferase
MSDRENSNIEIIENCYRAALELHLLEQFSQSIEKYKEVLILDEKHTDARLNLSEIYYIIGDYQSALSIIIEGLNIDPTNSRLFYMYGLALEKEQEIIEAISAYQKAISINSHLIDAYNNLGNLLCLVGQSKKSEELYRQAIKIEPQHFGAYLNLGNLQMYQNKVDDAVETYQSGLRVSPENPEILYNLGCAFHNKNDIERTLLHFGFSFYYNKNYQEAINYYQDYLKISSTNLSVYITLADCYRNLNQYEAAIAILEQALRINKTEDLYVQLIVTLQLAGQTEEAIFIADRATQILKNSISIQLEKPRILPIIYKKIEEIKVYRQKFISGLKESSKQVNLGTDENRKKAMIGISRFSNFYINYQGENDLEVQTVYGKLLHQILAANYPHWNKPISLPPLTIEGKIRVGYISSHMRNHSAAKTRLGWLRHRDRKQFDLYCYYTDNPIDSFTKLFQLHSDVFHHIPNSLDRVCQQIVNDRLHILVFLDLGMHPFTMQVAALRLAPVQCVGWVHPVTTGIPTIDYFISNELMEPENAEEHYSEKLVRLPNIGISYAKPLVPKLTKTRAEFRLKQEAVVYLCCQSLFKYLPQHDYIWGEVARQVPQSQFVFLSHKSVPITTLFQNRLQQTFESIGLNWQDYCIILPRQNQTDYWQLNLLSDIYLDNLSWSGCNTTLEAIACNLPIVTCPGELMRGRHTYGILKMLGVLDTIARNEADYINIAVRLGLDLTWRQNIIEQMVNRCDVLYNDRVCVKSLEAFYRQVVANQ